MTVPDAKIVVGVDGSDGSIDALRWAARQAELTGAKLHVVTAWAFPEHRTPFGIVFDIAESADPTARARSKLDDLIEDVLGKHEKVALRAEVIPGNEAAVLIEAARHADLLVVGSRGLGGFAGMVLGSVSAHCIRHARCPVVVIRHPE
ncbi:MAG TPA: universal stress protein [Acidimicrobiales bacterium]|nr:universal stress protein [Acidimicrobiales bacterium]